VGHGTSAGMDGVRTVDGVLQGCGEGSDDAVVIGTLLLLFARSGCCIGTGLKGCGEGGDDAVIIIVVVVVFGGSHCHCLACPPLCEVRMVGCCIGAGSQGAARAVMMPSSSSSSLVALVAAVRPALIVSW